MQNLTLVPDKWCQMYCSEYFNVFEYQKVCKIQGNTDLILGGAQCAELTSLNGTGGLGGGGETERYAPKKLMHSELFGS